MNDRIELHFSDFPSPRLLRTVLMSSGGSVVAYESSTAAPGAGSFRWGRGMRSLCLALLRLHLSLGATGAAPLLAGGRGSAASTLDSLVHKADVVAWLRNVLEIPRQDSAKQRLQAWFERQNSQLNARNRPVRLFAGRGVGGLPPDHITVYVGNRPAGLSAVRDMARTLSFELGEPAEEAVEVAGVLPTAGDGVIGREAELVELDDALASGHVRGVQIVAPEGIGKTGLASKWLDELVSGSCRPFERILICSFNKRGVTPEPMPPMRRFPANLVQALGIRLPEAAPPRETIRILLAALRFQPTLLVLDGVEAVLDTADGKEGRLRGDVLPGLLRAMLDETESFFVITTRTRVADFDHGRAGAVAQLNLAPLRREHTRLMLRALGVNGVPRDLDAAAALTKGSPLRVCSLASRFTALPRDSHRGLRDLLAELRVVSAVKAE